ncbi:J domain-containing protein [bacterium]|nr:J domain-containing protein [bacterium]
MIKKCDHLGCTKAGTCRAPKTRDLREYWWFCREHAAEYNKNWNYYANMTPAEIEADWERQTFGSAHTDRPTGDADAAKFIHDFVMGRMGGTTRPTPKSTPAPISAALKTLGLPVTATWRDVGVRYRALAKKYHPDTNTAPDAAAKFTQVSAAYDTLKKYFTAK